MAQPNSLFDDRRRRWPDYKLVIDCPKSLVYVPANGRLLEVADIRLAPALVKLWCSVAARPPIPVLSNFFDGATIRVARPNAPKPR